MALSRRGGNSSSDSSQPSLRETRIEQRRMMNKFLMMSVPLLLPVLSVHWVVSRQYCKALFDKLKREGENFSTWEFFPSSQPNARKAGHCKLLGPSARNDRFIDKRYETDN